MARKIERREFLRIAVAQVAVASSLSWVGGCDDDGDRNTRREKVFPQGIASGDPTDHSVVLWTRVEPKYVDSSEVVAYQVARDRRFAEVVASGELSADSNADHTVRLKLVDLEPGRRYYYRFRARSTRSPVGRTRTAAASTARSQVRFAVANCQDFVGRFYHAWQVLCEQEEDALDFVLFLGDYIYAYESGSDVLFELPETGRRVVIPDGLRVERSGRSVLAAVTLTDYRALYRQYRSDPWLRRAHQLFPFVCVWDDHEFANDCWQDHANDFNGVQGDEQSTTRRENATRAWFEYLPLDLDYAPGTGYPDDIRTWRNARFGKHLELVLTDQRYYRSDHVIPEGPIDLEVGKFLPNSPLGSRVLAAKSGFDRKEAVAGVTLLGAKQRKWLIRRLNNSEATWVIWGNAVPATQMLLDLSSFSQLPPPLRTLFYFKLDIWDGYRSERRRILEAVADRSNLVLLSGDIHAFYAAELQIDFDAPTRRSAALEFVTAGISSSTVVEQIDKIIRGEPALAGLGLEELVKTFDANLRANGSHYRYANSNTHGLSIVEVNGRRLDVTFLEVDDVRSAKTRGVSRRTRFRVASGSRKIQVTE